MKAKVTNAFCDATANDRLYLPGSDYEADEARIAALERGGYVKRAEGKKPAANTARKRTAAKTEE